MLCISRDAQRRGKKKAPLARGFLATLESVALQSFDQRPLRVPTTSISTRRFFARAGRVVLAVDRVGSDRLALALALGVDAIGFDTLADQVSLDRFGTTHRQLLVVGDGTDAVRVTDRDDDFEVDRTELADEVVQLGLAFRLERGLVEVEECVGCERHLLADRAWRRRDRSRRGSRRCRRHDDGLRYEIGIALVDRECRSEVAVAPAQAERIANDDAARILQIAAHRSRSRDVRERWRGRG